MYQALRAIVWALRKLGVGADASYKLSVLARDIRCVQMDRAEAGFVSAIEALAMEHADLMDRHDDELVELRKWVY
jgi:hypothetical protein